MILFWTPVKSLMIVQEIWSLILVYTKNWLVSWSNDKELLSKTDIISWNSLSLKKKKNTNLLLIAPGPLSKGRATLCAWPPKFILNHLQYMSAEYGSPKSQLCTLLSFSNIPQYLKLCTFFPKKRKRNKKDVFL